MKKPIPVPTPSTGKRVVPRTYELHLKQLKWRDISFPFSEMNSNMEQVLVAHSYPDRDAAHLESMGREPLVITCKVPFNNYILTGKGETWVAGDLFPSLFNKFMEACKDSSPGILFHPLFGKITVKCKSASTLLTANDRGGVTVDVKWIETVNVAAPTFGGAPNLSGAATQMMDELARVKLVMPADFPDKGSLLDLIDKIGNLVSAVQLIGMQLSAYVDRTLYHVNRLLNIIGIANDNLLGQLKMLAEKLKASLLNLKRTATLLLVAPLTYVVAATATVAEVASTLGVGVADLVRLNPKECAKPVLAQGIRLKYVVTK